MNYATSTHSELAHAGYTITVLPSAAKKRNRKSALGVRPACNHAGHVPTPAAQANQTYRGEAQG